MSAGYITPEDLARIAPMPAELRAELRAQLAAAYGRARPLPAPLPAPADEPPKPTLEHSARLLDAEAARQPAKLPAQRKLWRRAIADILTLSGATEMSFEQRTPPGELASFWVGWHPTAVELSGVHRSGDTGDEALLRVLERIVELHPADAAVVFEELAGMALEASR
jgi:hypothetical protein